MYPYGEWYRNLLRGLGGLLRAGVPIREALEQLASGSQGGRVARTARFLAWRIAQGDTLGEAAALARWIPPEHAALIEAGERTGRLDRALDRALEAHDSRVRRAKESLRALAWPLVEAAAAALLLPLYFLVLGQPGVYIAIQAAVFGPAALAALAFGFGLPRRGGSLAARLFEGLALGAPWLGKTVREFALGRFFGTLGAVLQCGLSLEESLDLASRTLRFERLRGQAAELPGLLRRGRKLHEALGALPEFRLGADRAGGVAAGEISGRLDEALLEVARDLAAAGERRVRRFARGAALLILVAIGVLIFLRILSVYQGALESF